MLEMELARWHTRRAWQPNQWVPWAHGGQDWRRRRRDGTATGRKKLNAAEAGVPTDSRWNGGMVKGFILGSGLLR